MAIKTRLFGKKVKGRTLSNLVEALGENWKEVGLDKNEKYSITKLYGRCNLSPKEDFVEVDLYIFRTDTHEVDGTSNEDYKSGQIGRGHLIENKIISYDSVRHLQGKINY